VLSRSHEIVFNTLLSPTERVYGL